MPARRITDKGEQSTASLPTGDERSSHSNLESDEHRSRRHARGAASGRLLDVKAVQMYSAISAWTLRDLIASDDPSVDRWFLQLRRQPKRLTSFEEYLARKGGKG